MQRTKPKPLTYAQRRARALEIEARAREGAREYGPWTRHELGQPAPASPGRRNPSRVKRVTLPLAFYVNHAKALREKSPGKGKTRRRSKSARPAATAR
jgi:hypothetical protein